MKMPGGAVDKHKQIAGARAVLIVAIVSGAAAQSDPAAIAENASRAMADRRFADAAELYGQLAQSYPAEPSLQANLGMALHLSARDEAAVGPLRTAASAMPSSFPAHFFLGASLSRLGQYAEAVDPLRQAARLNPEHPFARALLGDALEAVGNFAEAAQTWQSLREQDADNPFPLAGLVRCHEQLAAEVVEALKQRDPESAHILRLLAHARLTAGQYPSALFLFRQALARARATRHDHEAVADLYERSGHADWAAVERIRATALPLTDCSSSSSAECNFRAGRFDAASAVPSAASSEDLYWKARAHARLAARSFAGLRELGESFNQLQLIADILASQAQYSDAADACRRALELRHGDPGLERQMAELLYRARRFDEVLPLLERLLQSDSQDPRWPAMLGGIFAEQQEFEKAIPLLEAAVALPDGGPSARVDLGRSYLSIGRPEEAATHLRASLGTDTDGSVHYQLAQAYQRLGMRDQARAAMNKYQLLNAQARQETEAAAALTISPPD